MRRDGAWGGSETNNPATINRLVGRGRGESGITDISASIIPTGAVEKGGKKESLFGDVIGGSGGDWRQWLNRQLVVSCNTVQSSNQR